jgi:transcriptional regulator with XRE-family HTH domain
MPRRVRNSSFPRQHTFLREWREYNDLSVDAAAAKMGTSGATVSRIENGKSPYTQDHLENMARVYGTTTAKLLDVRPDVAAGGASENKEGQMSDRAQDLDQRAKAPGARSFQDNFAYPPRAMRLGRAAAYLDISPSTFLRLVDDGLLPRPTKVRGVVSWDRLDLDAAYEDWKAAGDGNTVHALLAQGRRKD